MASCSEKFGDRVDNFISDCFSRVGAFVGSKPKFTIVCSFLITLICGAGFATWETESRPEELWVPQDTTADAEKERFLEVFPPTARFNTMIVQTSTKGGNILAQESLEEAMRMHQEIETRQAAVEGENYDLVDLCTRTGGSCASSMSGVCQCFITSILRQWNYNLTTLQNDENILDTLSQYGSRDDLEAVLGKPIFDEAGQIVKAEAFSLSYFLEDRSVVKDGAEEDVINEGWEKDVFLDVVESVPEDYSGLSVDYFAARSFSDEFGGAVKGDLSLVYLSYGMAFLFLAATLGKFKCGTGSRWSLAFAAQFTVGLSTVAGFGFSSLCGLFFGPVHALLPFVLLGIGVDDAFVIVNAFNRERKVSRVSEDNEALVVRSARSLARAGASITVTSATDLVAFSISSSSALPALASFCAYAAISIFFLWFFSATFFTAALVLDERRQRDNRKEFFCCITRSGEIEEDTAYEEGRLSHYFRRYHAPAILSRKGKAIILLVFSGLLAFGIFGTMNLSVEDTERKFIPPDSYFNDYLDAADEYFPEQGIDLYITFEGSENIYAERQSLAELDTRLTGLSTAPPYIAEPVSEEAYRNVMDGFAEFLVNFGTEAIGGAPLGDDNWPMTEPDFVSTLAQYASFTGPGAQYARDVAFSLDGTELNAIRVQAEYIKLVKVENGEIIDDADKLIDAMDSTRAMVDSWDDLPPAFPHSDKFLVIEGFKIIRKELFQNAGLALLAVGIIVYCTVASPVTALLITVNVAFCIVEILGFMYAAEVVIDSVSVINIVLAVGLSVDYSAHIGHCFMVKGGADKDQRVTESLADIGASVLNGAVSTFLAVVVLLFSSSYVFATLSTQFALTVAIGIAHGLLLLPVLLALLGPKAFSSAEELDISEKTCDHPLTKAKSGSGEDEEAASHGKLPSKLVESIEDQENVAISTSQSEELSAEGLDTSEKTCDHPLTDAKSASGEDEKVVSHGILPSQHTESTIEDHESAAISTSQSGKQSEDQEKDDFTADEKPAESEDERIRNVETNQASSLCSDFLPCGVPIAMQFSEEL